MRENQAHVVIVMGVSGSGKSSVARAIAQHLDYEFVEGDDFHSQENKQRMASNKPLTDEMRIPWVNDICHYLKQQISQGKKTVLSFSGLRKQHRQQLAQLPASVKSLFLYGDIDTIEQRMKSRKGHFMPPSLLTSQFEAMQVPDNEANTKLVSVDPSLQDVVADCLSYLQNDKTKAAHNM